MLLLWVRLWWCVLYGATSSSFTMHLCSICIWRVRLMYHV